MIKWLCSYMFGGHRQCKEELHTVNKQMKSLEARVGIQSGSIETYQTSERSLINQIQELKAVNDYQTFQLEQKIKELEEINKKLEEDASKLDLYLCSLEDKYDLVLDKYDKLYKKLTKPRYANLDGMILPLGPIVVNEETISKDDNGNTDNSTTDKKD